MTRLPTAIAAAVLLTGCNTNTSTEMTTPTADTTASLSRSDWDLLRTQTIYFGHQSIGTNVLDGLAQIAEGERWPALRVVEAASVPNAEAVLLHNKVGQNGDPTSKIVDFKRGLEAGVGAHADIALMKFCFWDIRADTDVNQVFADYQNMVSTMAKAFPRLTLMHATVPLVVRDNDWRARIRRMLGQQVPTDLDNAKREVLNQQIRAAYGTRVFDIARAEVDGPIASAGVPYLADGFSSDGAHLNQAGRRQVAAAFVRSLAAAARTRAGQQ